MLTSLVQQLAYSCAACSAFTCRPIRVFDLPKNHTTAFFCDEEDRGEEVLRITPKNTGYHIEAECSCCGDRHSYTLSKSLFWNTQLHELSCPSCGIGIVLIGSKDRVDQAIDEQEEFLSSFAGDFFPEEHAFLSLTIAQAIHSLSQAHAIFCRCGSEQITAKEELEHYTLTCRQCGNQIQLPISDETLDQLLHASTFVLHK